MGINDVKLLNNEIDVNDELSYSPLTPEQGTYDQLNQLFTEQDRQEKTIQEAKDILGESANSLTDEQIYDLTNEVQYLVDSWLEEFERKAFDGKTLTELLGEGKI